MEECKKANEVQFFIEEKLSKIFNKRGQTYWERIQILESIQTLVSSWRVACCKNCEHRKDC